MVFLNIVIVHAYIANLTTQLPNQNFLQKDSVHDDSALIGVFLLEIALYSLQCFVHPGSGFAPREAVEKGMNYMYLLKPHEYVLVCMSKYSFIYSVGIHLYYHCNSVPSEQMTQQCITCTWLPLSFQIMLMWTSHIHAKMVQASLNV